MDAEAAEAGAGDLHGVGRHREEDEPPRWYAMLAPDKPLPDGYRRVGRPIAAATGGTLFAYPHVSVAYLQGMADPAAVANRLRHAPGRNVRVRAQGAFSFWETAHPIVGYTLSLHVAKHAAFALWHTAVVEALRPLGLAPTLAWDEVQLHVRVVQHMAIPPSEAVRRLGPMRQSLRFTATQLWVTMLEHGAFRDCLRRPLDLVRGPLVGAGP